MYDEFCKFFRLLGIFFLLATPGFAQDPDASAPVPLKFNSLTPLATKTASKAQGALSATRTLTSRQVLPPESGNKPAANEKAPHSNKLNPNAVAQPNPLSPFSPLDTPDVDFTKILASTNRLDLATCQSVARTYNRGLRATQNNFSSALAGKKIANSEVFAPDLSLSQTFNDDNEQGEIRAELNYLTPLGFEFTPFLNENIDTDREEQWFSNAGVRLRRRLFNASERWRLRLPLTRAERNILQAQNNLQREKRELDFEVMRTFLAVQRVENRLRVRRDRVADALEFLQVTKDRVAADIAAKVDIVNATISVNQAEADRLSEETSLRSQTEALLNTMGLNITNQLTIAPYDLDSHQRATFDLDNDSVNLLTRHESLVNAQLDIEFSKVEIRIQKDLLRPQLDLSLTAEHRSRGSNIFNENENDEDPLTIQVEYSTPLDGKRAQKARLDQLQIALENAETALINEENRLLLDLRSAHRNILALEIQVGLNEQRIEAEQQKLKATLIRYEDGDVDNLEVTRAKQSVDNAEIALINTNIDLVLAQERYRSLLPPNRPAQTTLTPP